MPKLHFLYSAKHSESDPDFLQMTALTILKVILISYMYIADFIFFIALLVTIEHECCSVQVRIAFRILCTARKIRKVVSGNFGTDNAP